MELMAAIVALRSIKQRCKVRLHSDSQYLVKAMNENWPQTWQKNSWTRGRKERVKNPDLWQELLDLIERHDVEFIWVRGHSGIVENERADRLSVMAANEPDLPPDPGYSESPK